MTDRELQQLFPDYFAGRLDPDLSRSIEQRCEHSAELREALTDAQKYFEAISAIEPLRAPDDFLDKVHRRIKEQRGLFDRIFKPFQNKLPIELAGVVVTVLLVILIYNPFSGKLPQQLVKQRSAEYEKLQNAPPAAQPAQPEPAPAEQSAPKKDKLPGAATHTQSNRLPRRTVAAKARPVDTQQVRKKVSAKSSALPTAQPSVKITSEKTAIAMLADESFAPEQNEQASGFVEMEKSAVPNLETEKAPQSPMPARLSNSASVQPAPSSAPRMQKQETARGAVISGMSDMAPDVDASMDKVAPAPAAASIARSETKLSKKKQSKEYAAEQPAATLAPPTEAKIQQPEQSTLLQQVEKMVHRYRGTIDSIILNSDDQVKIKISITPKKLVELKKVLSDAFIHPDISDFLSGSSDKKVLIIVEIHRQ